MHQHTILLADDEPHITHVVAHKLRGAGLNVVVASDGEDAFQQALAHAPSLIVTDLQMPHLSGIELATRLASHDATCAIPIILLTARGYFLEPGEIEKTGIREVMAKPFTARGLLQRILEILGTEPVSGRSVA